MASKNSFEDLVNAKIATLVSRDLRAILGVSSSKRQYPKDCINNGGLDRLVTIIAGYEQEIIRLGGTVNE